MALAVRCNAAFNELHCVLIFNRVLTTAWVSMFVSKHQAMFICLLTVSMAFVLMLTSSDCLPLGDEPDNNAIQLFCEDHQYSAMGSLLFNTAEDSIKNLYFGFSLTPALGSLHAAGTLPTAC